jgi:hypothetical protein
MAPGADDRHGSDEEPRVEPRGGPGEDEEALELIELQESMLDRLYEAPAPETRELAESLGMAMRQVAEDGAFWDGLERAGRLSREIEPSDYLALVDWETLLRKWGLPDVEQTALELIVAVDRGAGRELDWKRVRELIYQLGAEISGEAIEMPARRGPLGRLKERMAAGVSVLRRIRVGKLVVNAGMGGGVGAAPILAGAAAGASLGPIGILAGAVAVGVGTGASSEIRAAAKRLPKEDQSLLSGLFANQELGPGAFGQARAQLTTIETLVGGQTLTACEASLPMPLANLRLWAARVGARLLSSWPVIEARLGAAMVNEVRSVLDATMALQRTLRTVATLCGTATDSARRVIATAYRQIAEVGGQLRGLNVDLGRQGFGSHLA